jgi:hypothetical protein
LVEVGWQNGVVKSGGGGGRTTQKLKVPQVFSSTNLGNQYEWE